MHVKLPEEIKFLLSKFPLTLFVLRFGRVEWICKLASSHPVVPGILGTAISCIQGGIPIGLSVLMVLFGRYCFLTGR